MSETDRQAETAKKQWKKPEVKSLSISRTQTSPANFGEDAFGQPTGVPSG